MVKHKALLSLLAATQLVWSSVVMAQSPKGTITGTAVDSNQAPLPGALVAVMPGDKKTATDAHGTFRVPDLTPGVYDLTVSYVGFSEFTSHVTVAAGETAAVAAVLKVASISDQVLVTAERPQGEAAAINIERTADNIVQVLPASVITSLPNTNIADAVGRAPSVTLERDEGEGKYVQIRGTEPRLSNVTINGVHVPSPEAGVRNIKLDAVPSDLVDRIEINKTLSANQDADAIGGSVNLVTKTPGSKPQYSFFGRDGYTAIQNGRSLGGVDLTAGRRFGSQGQFGLLVGGTYDHNNRGIDDLEPSQAIGNISGRPFALISSEDFRTYQYDRTRYGFDGDLDYTRPGWSAYVRGLYADFHDFGSTFVYTPITGAIVSNSGAHTVFDNTGSMAYREYIRRPDQGVFSISTGGNSVTSSSDVVSYQFAVSRGHNAGGQDFPTTNFNGPSGVMFGLDESDPLRPAIRPIDSTNIFDPTAYTISNTVLPNYHSAELDLEGSSSWTHDYNLGSRSSLFEAGVKVRDAHKTQTENDQFFNATGAIAMNQVLGGGTNANYYSGFFPYGPLTDYSKIQNLITTQLSSGFAPNSDKNRIVSDPATWDTRERVAAGYLMNTVSFSNAKIQAGVRIEATNTNFHANQVTLNSGAYDHTSPVTGSGSNVNALPSVQAQIAITPNTNLRLAYGWGISRPNFQDLVPSVQVDPNTSPKSLQVGNPALKPTRSMNYDLLLEHYFQPLGILQGGVFYKALTNPIYFTATFVPATDPNFAGFLRQQSINGPSAYIAGFETAWQQRLSVLPGPLGGLGIAANYSWTTSRVTFPNGFSSAVPGGQGRIDHPTLPRQAPNTWNFGLTYDVGRLSARLGISHNDANLFAYGYVHDPTNPNVDSDPILGIKGPLGDQYLYAHTQVDVQGSYRVVGGWEVVVSGLNLTNEVFGFFTGSPIYPNQREFYKATVIVGLRLDPTLR
jgi:TonB-dependent receptor